MPGAVSTLHSAGQQPNSSMAAIGADVSGRMRNGKHRST